MCANIVNRIICVGQKYLKPFECVQKMCSSSFKDVLYKMCLQIVYI